MRLRIPSLLSVALMAVTLLGCTGEPIQLPCYDLPGTEARCEEPESTNESAKITLSWECVECMGVRQGYAPLMVNFWLVGIEPDPDSPILWEIVALNSGVTEREFTPSAESLSYTFEFEDVYAVSASYKNLDPDPVEIRVDVNEVEANWSTPWKRGDLCDARIHMLADPESQSDVPYFIEVVVKRDGLEAIKIRDWVPYRLKFPEYVHGHRITPHTAPKPYRFPSQIEPQVILFDAAGPLNQVWDVEVQCLHPNRFEELHITTRL